jgi:hypothetical protein
MSELKPCPFCGGKVKPAATKRAGHDIYFSIVCHCGLEYSDQCATAEDLHRNWNRRVDGRTIIASATGFGFICQGNNFRGGSEPLNSEIPRAAFESYLLQQEDDDECFEGPYNSAHKNTGLHYWNAAINWIRRLNQ